MESVNKLRLDFIFPSSRREGAVAATVLNKRRVPGWRLVKGWPATWRLTIGRWLCAMVVVITITTILSMVLEETVRAMRKKDTWDKVVQPALYVRRSVFIDLKILHLQENLFFSPPDHYFCISSSGWRMQWCARLLLRANAGEFVLCRSQVFLSQQFVKISQSFSS